MRRAPLPPKSPAPVSHEYLQIVKKKVSGPPAKPLGTAIFNAPKKYQDFDENRLISDDEETVDEEYRRNASNFRPPQLDPRRAPPPRKVKDDAWSRVAEKRPSNSNDAYEMQDFSDSEEDHDRKNAYRDSSYHHKTDNADTDSNNGIKRNDNTTRRRPKQDIVIENNDDDEEEVDFGNNRSEKDTNHKRKGSTNDKSGKPIGYQGSATLPQASKITIFNFRPILQSTYRDLRTFVLSAPPPGQVVRCYIERNRGGTNMLSPFYSLCADLEDGTGRELLVCRKVLRSRSPHYVFSLKSEDLWRKREQRSRLYLGKLRATSASEYVLYDSGEMDVPKLGGSSTSHLEQEDDEDAEGEPGEGGRGPVGHRRQGDEMRTSLTSAKGSISSALNDVETSLYRQQMAVIVFNTKARPVADDTRGMEVCVPVPGPAPRPGDAGEGKGLSFVASAPSKSSDIQTPFQRIRGEGRQNELWHQKYFVLHERQSK